MNIFGSTKLNSLEDLSVYELQDIYDAEHRIVDSLPQMIDVAHSSDLKNSLQKHLAQTKRQITRLEEVFTQLGKEADRVTCNGMKGLLEEGEELLDLEGDADVKDEAIISACQRVEHYEISAYGSCRTYAEQLGHRDVVDLLQTTLDEESETDKELTRLAEQSVNIRTQHA